MAYKRENRKNKTTFTLTTFSWNFTISCTRFLSFQEGENSCAGGPNKDFQLGKRPKSLGWMVWTGRLFE